MRIGLSVIIASLIAVSCAAEEQLTSCGDFQVLSNSLTEMESFPQYYLPSYSLYGLPMSGEPTMAMLSVRQLTVPGDGVIDFKISKGCFSLARLIDLQRTYESPTQEYCFERTQQLALVPSRPGQHPCAEPICASPENLKSAAAELSAISNTLRSQTEMIELGIIVESKISYRSSYEVSWFDRSKPPIYKVTISAGDAELIVEGVHAAIDGSRFRICRNRDLTSLLATGG